MFSIKAVMIGIKEFFSSEDKWTQGSNFRDVNGLEVSRGEGSWPRSVHSCCLLGAKAMVLHQAGIAPLTNEWMQVYQHMYKCALNPSEGLVMSFNDNPDTTFEKIHRYLDVCIAHAPS